MHTNRFIVFEGICCSGKTTIAKKIANKYGYTYSKASPSFLEIGKILREKYQFSYNYSDVFYVSDLIAYTKDFLKTRMLKDEVIVQDRYFDSIIAFSNACNRLKKELDYNVSSQINYLKKGKYLLKPDIIVYCYATEEIILERIKQEKSPIHNFYLDNPQLIKYVLAEYEEILSFKKCPIIRVDTGVNSITNTIKKLKLSL